MEIISYVYLLNSNIIGTSFLKSYDNLYMLETIASYNEIFYEKSQSLDVFKTFKVEVENQINKRIKSVRSDCGSE